MNKVEFRNVTLSYGKNTVVKGFNLAVKDQEIIGIVGPSGCGKTTIIRALSGLKNPDSGEIYVDGNPYYSKEKRANVPPERRNIGVVFQDYAVWPHLSVFDNVAYPLKKRKLPADTIREKVMEALGQVNMVGYEKYMPSQLSGGQQQRVAIARALTSSSDLVIMDEPITNLDAKLRESMLVEIRLMQQRLGTTIIYITHDQEAALQLCDRVVILDHSGDIAQIGTDEDIIKFPSNKFVF
jgi:iron(III) transport system ATP-binding protein